MKISFELICEFLGSWDNLKIKKKHSKIISKPTKKVSNFQNIFIDLSLKCFGNSENFLISLKIFLL